jgi:hypothetical protein
MILSNAITPEMLVNNPGLLLHKKKTSGHEYCRYLLPVRNSQSSQLLHQMMALLEPLL